MYLSIHPSFYLSVYPSIYPSIYISYPYVCMYIIVYIYICVQRPLDFTRSASSTSCQTRIAQACSDSARPSVLELAGKERAAGRRFRVVSYGRCPTINCNMVSHGIYIMFMIAMDVNLGYITYNQSTLIYAGFRKYCW